MPRHCCWRKRIGFALLTLIVSTMSGAQTAILESTKPTITIQRVNHPPKLEDFLDMKPSASAPPMTKVNNFIQRDPKDGAPAQQKTDVYLGYDAKNFYAIFICFDEDSSRIRARMTRREDIGPASEQDVQFEHDQVQLYLDTFADQRRSYGFMTNPLGIQYDFIWTDILSYDPSWDTVWDSRGRITSQGYVAFMAIPFKSLRFSSAREQTWGILLQRVVPHSNDNSFFPHVSASIYGRLSQESELHGLEDIRPGRNIQLIPYGLIDSFHALDQRDPSHPFFTGKNLGGRAGLDGKFILKDSLVFDFTVNPDFRQLESDQPQNTVNQRFEVFFPEKRPFFQEGANYFETPINMYFTRRIANPQFGVRVTGKLGPYGIGVLASDDQSPGLIVPDNDPLHGKRAYFTVGRLTRELWKQSQIGIYYSDREMDAVPDSLCATNAVNTTEQIACVSRSNRVGGPDFTFHFGDHLQIRGQALASATDQINKLHFAGSLFALTAEYTSRHISYALDARDITSGFVTLMGFYQRPDIRKATNTLSYLFRPEGAVVTSWGPRMFQRTTYDHAGNQLDAIYEPSININLRKNTNISIYSGHWRELLRPSDYSVLTHNTDFNKGDYFGTSVTSSYLGWMSVNANFFTGKNINFDPPTNRPPVLANETQLVAGMTVHPFNRLSIANDYILERLTSRTEHAAIINSHVVRSKWNYQYNKQLSFRAIAQYDALLTNPQYTNLASSKNINADFLITYLVHPGTAFYLGYNSNLQNLDPFTLARTPGRYINDGRTFYAKISYLFRF